MVTLFAFFSCQAPINRRNVGWRPEEFAINTLNRSTDGRIKSAAAKSGVGNEPHV